MTPVCAPVSPRAARYSSESGKHKPCGKKQPFVGGFLTLLRKSAGGLPCFPSQDTADGNADRIRLSRAFEGDNKNCDLGVAVFERKIRQKKEMI